MIELPADAVRDALAFESSALWLAEGLGKAPEQAPLLLAALDEKYQDYRTVTDVATTFCAVSHDSTPDNAPTTDLFSATSNPNLATQQATPDAPSSGVNADNSTLVSNSVFRIGGLFNVNTATGNTAYANNLLADHVRPGAQELTTEILGSQLAQNFRANPGLADSLVWAPEVKAVAMNLLATGVATAIPTDPLVLDLNGDGVKLTSFADAPVLFDIDHDSTASKEITGWFSKEDGIVVMDLNGNGKIDGIHETMSEYFNGTAGSGGNPGEKKYANGFAALKSLDSNADHQFTSADAAWSNVKVWVDADHDGVTDSGELTSLTALGITSIDLAPTNQSGLVNGGNEVLATGTFIQNGVSKEAQAARFIANPTGNVATVTANGTTVSAEDGQSTYVSSLASGETIDVAAKGVKNAYGNQGNDTLTGNAGANWLVGGQGSDTFNAGAGDDMLIIDAEDLQQNIHAGDGDDIDGSHSNPDRHHDGHRNARKGLHQDAGHAASGQRTDMESSRMKLHRSIYYLSALVMASTLSLATAQTSSTPPARHDLPWDQRSYEDRLYNGRYEDRYTYKHKKPYTYDPWTWGYTKEFAERFHMPEQWIEPDLKGALAVAFRMTVIDVITQCGIGGKEDNCWTPKAECQLDVYYDSRISLPWNYPEVMRDNLMGGLHSGQYLHDPTFRSRGVNRHFYGRRDANDPEKDKPMGAGSGGGAFQYGRYNQGISILALFDREYQPGVGLISWIGNGVCPEYTGPEQVYMSFLNKDDVRAFTKGQIKAASMRPLHRIDFPPTYLQRAKAVYDAQKGASDEAINRLIKGFFESRKAAPKVP